MKKAILSIATLFVFNVSAQIPGTPFTSYSFTNGSNAGTNGAADLTPTTGGAPFIATQDRHGDWDDAALLTKTLSGFVSPSTNYFSTTLSFWINHSGAGASNQRILQIYGGSGAGYQLELAGNSLFLEGSAVKQSGSNALGSIQVSTTLTDNQWHHIVVRTKRVNLYSTNDAIQVDIFVDNIILTGSAYIFGSASPGSPALVSFVQNSTFKLRPINNYSGMIDDIHFYTTNLSTADVNSLYIDSPTSSLSEENMTSISVYPNPSVDKVHFESEKEIVNIELYTISGQKVATFDNTADINISALPNGVYMAKISLSKGQFSFERILKK